MAKFNCCLSFFSFFEYYEDALYPFYHKPYQYLFDFNLALTRQIVQLLKVDKILQVTDSYQKITPPTLWPILGQFTTPLKAKAIDANYTPPVYSQVFEPQAGFLPNVSILDLLFAEVGIVCKYYNRQLFNVAVATAI